MAINIQRMRAHRLHKGSSEQRGVALLLAIVVLLAIGAVVVLNGVGSNAIRNERQVKTTSESLNSLEAAKQALIGYVVQSIDGGEGYRLGNFPLPDSLGDSVYNGVSDSNNRCLSNGANGLPAVINGKVSTNLRQSTQRCIGKLPWRTLSLDFKDVAAHDPVGTVPWLAISANLNSWDQCLAALNSDVVNWPTDGGTSCPSALNTLPYSWLTVVDQNGNTISNRVAAVLILPGAPIQTGNRSQSRKSSSPGAPGDYLDMISLPLGCAAGCASTFDNAGMNNTFIQIPPGTRYPASSENTSLAGQVISFNDVLVYITIDELMPYVERRVVSEQASALATFAKNQGHYPWLSKFDSAIVDSTSLINKENTIFGALPFMTSYSAGGQLPAYRTDFDWSIRNSSELPVNDCFEVQTSPSRWISNSLGGTMSAYLNGTANEADGRCVWKGNTSVSCTTTQNTNNVSYSAPVWYSSLTKCTNGTNPSGGPLAYVLTRTVTAAFELNTSPPSCKSSSYVITKATASDVTRWSWQCNSDIENTGLLLVEDRIQGTSIKTGGIKSAGVATKLSSPPTPSISISRMRYHPVMPKWFNDNGWYKTAFAMVAPSSAPSIPSLNPCSAATLNVGQIGNVHAVAIQAGKNLGANARPTSVLADYLEGANLNAPTTCNFSAQTLIASPTMNDQLQSVTQP